STLVSFYRLLPPPPPPSFPTRRSSDLSSTCAFIPQNHSFYHDPHQTLKINSRMLIESGIFRSYQGLNNVLWYRVKRYIETVLPVDRKSTRLNSSHVKISYAVFCLKKKK